MEAHTGGVVTSSTLMANGAAFSDAVQLARNVPALSIGCHVVLIDGEPVLEAAQISFSHFGGALPRWPKNLRRARHCRAD